MDPHAAELQQVPDRHVGLAHRARTGLLPVLSAGLHLSVRPVHAEIQDSAGGWSQSHQQAANQQQCMQKTADSAFLHNARIVCYYQVVVVVIKFSI